MSATISFPAVINPGLPGWNSAPEGPWGFMSGIKISDNGTQVAKSDVAGAWKWTGTEWVQLLTPATLPSNIYYGEANPFDDVAFSTEEGCYEVAIAPSNPNYIYATLNGYLLATSNGGTGFYQTGLARRRLHANEGAARIYNDKMAVDPVNPAVVYFCDQTTGTFRSLDAGVTFPQIASLPAPTANSYGLVAIDRSSITTNGRKPRVAVFVPGSDVYLSTDCDLAVPTFTDINMPVPTDISHMFFDEIGALYCCRGSSTLYRYEAGAWTAIACPVNVTSAAVDPANNNRLVIISADGHSAISPTTRGASWSEARNAGTNNPSDYGWDMVAIDVPALNTVDSTAVSNITFDRSQVNKLYMGMGVGIYQTNYPNDLTVAGNPRLVWTSQSQGIKELTTHHILCPPASVPLLISWDRPFIRLGSLIQPPQTYGPQAALRHGAGADYASDNPLNMAGWASFFSANPQAYACTSNDGGKTWTRCTAQPQVVEGGCIAMNTTGNFIIVPGMEGVPVYTLDGGETFSPIVLPAPGMPAGEKGFFFSNMLQRAQIVTADKTTPFRFFLRSYLSGLYESIDGGVNWVKVNAGTILPFSTFHPVLKAVPGKTGHLFMAGGDSTPAIPADVNFVVSVNGGVDFNPIPNIKEVKAFDFGTVFPGETYPSIHIAGHVGGVFSYWRCTDFNPANLAAGTWVDKGVPNNVASIRCIGASKTVQGQVIAGAGNSGYFYGNFA